MIPSWRFLTLYFLLISSFLFKNYFDQEVIVPVPIKLANFPVSVGSWRMMGEERFETEILDVLRPTDYLLRYYTSGAKPITLYIGYHGGIESGTIHSPKHCLPGGGWCQLSSREIDLEVDGSTLSMVRAVYQKGEQKELFLYWFQVGGNSLSNEYSLKVAEIINSLRYRRRDAAFVRVSVPIDNDEEQAFMIGTGFIRDIYPHIGILLPR